MYSTLRGKNGQFIMQKGPHICGVHPSCEGEDACYGNIMHSLVCKGGGDREEFTVPKHGISMLD